MKTTCAGVILLILLAGCGGGGVGGQVNSVSSAPNEAGTWTFTGNSKVFNLTFTGAGAILQTGNSWTGQLALSGRPCATSGTLTGAMNETAVSFQIKESAEPVSFSARSLSEIDFDSRQIKSRDFSGGGLC